MEKYVSKFQCGFRKGYRTQQCLIALLEKWKSATDKGKSFEALLTDLSMAFNCLPHEQSFQFSCIKACSQLFF